VRRFLLAFSPLAIVAACHGAAPRSTGPGATMSASAVARLRTSIDSIADAPAFRNAHWGILVVVPGGDTLYSRNAGKLFMPASNQKLLTGAVALAQLGPDFRYRTTFVARGPVIAGTIAGDLAVVGRGDPALSDHMQKDAMAPLRAIADTLYARGIRRITGRVVAGGNAFPDAVLGFGWSWDDLEAGYSAAVDELLFNEGFSTVVVRPGDRVGAPARAETRPAKSFPSLRILARTAPRGAGDTTAGARRASIRIVKDTVTGEIVVMGAIALGDSSTQVVTHRDPAAAYVAAVREAVIGRGIVVEDVGEPSPDVEGFRGDTLAALQSPPLREILPALMKPSQNQIAEMLLKTLGLERGRAGSAVEGRRIVEAQLTAWGAVEGGYVVRDGSGLSRYDYVSPETIVKLLDAMRVSPLFADFYASLPIAGVDGTVRSRMRGTAAENNVRAKTGSVAQARSLSGYVRSADGQLLVFSTMANNWTVPARDVERAADSIVVRLANFRGR
jgi:D-alanyl-D-alanine carboxypeptidase/D-alanyl-D-alanine-endopeptidase (penicillin-binding protein 4)